MVFVYLNGYFLYLCRLDSGGETSPKATFLATTSGLRRLFYLLFNNKSNFCSKILLFPPFTKLFSKTENHIKIKLLYQSTGRNFSPEKPLRLVPNKFGGKTPNPCGFLHSLSIKDEGRWSWGVKDHQVFIKFTPLENPVFWTRNKTGIISNRGISQTGTKIFKNEEAKK